MPLSAALERGPRREPASPWPRVATPAPAPAASTGSTTDDSGVRVHFGADPSDGTGWYSDDGIAIASEPFGDAHARTIADLYRERGLGCVPRLEPPFAFALFDRARQRLVAASDLTSGATIAYFTSPRTVAVCSRVLPLLAHPDADRELDELYLAHLFAGFHATPAGTTAFHGIKRLPAGVALVADRAETRLERVDRLVPRAGLSGRGGAWDEAFWRELAGAVDRATKSSAPACLSLSGGLDSAAVAYAAVGRQDGGAVGAFSVVAPSRPADEAEAISLLERRWPDRLRVERIDGSHADRLDGLDPLELFDDPVLDPIAILPARLLLWGAARRAGYRTVLDGEGGDELFGALCGPRAALGRGEWGTAVRFVWSSRGQRRSLARRAFVLPALPVAWQRAWARRTFAERTGSLPSYLTAEARAHPALKLAGEQFYEAHIDVDFPDEVLRWLSSPALVGARATHRRLAGSVGVTLASPLLDRRVVETILGAPSARLLAPGDRSLLRRAAAGRVPDEIVTSDKDVRLPCDWLRRIAGSDETRERLRDPALRDRFGRWVRFARVEGVLDVLARGDSPVEETLWRQVSGVIALAYFYPRVRRENGVG